MRARGFSIATVLMLAAIAVVAAFALVATTTAHMQTGESYASGVDAQNLAEGAMNQAIANLQADPASTATVMYPPGAQLDTRYGVVTFDRTLGVAWSTSNVSGASSTGAGNVPVAKGQVYLVATGRSGHATRTVYARVGLPTFDFALMANGPIVADGGLSVTGVGHVGTSGTMALGSPCTVGGDLVAPDEGTRTPIVLADPPHAAIGGILRAGTVQVPAIDLASFDTATNNHATPQRVDTLASPTPMTGAVDFAPPSGTLTVSGDVTLDNGIVYVQGNLTVNGSVHGRGALVVRGTASIMQGAPVPSTPDQLVALLADGDLTVGPPNASALCFAGLLYTHGRLLLQNLTLQGVAITSAYTDPNAPQTTPPDDAHSMKIVNAPVVYNPDATTLALSFGPAKTPNIFTFNFNVRGSLFENGFAYDPTDPSMMQTQVVNETQAEVNTGGWHFGGSPPDFDAANIGPPLVTGPTSLRIPRKDWKRLAGGRSLLASRCGCLLGFWRLTGVSCIVASIVPDPWTGYGQGCNPAADSVTQIPRDQVSAWINIYLTPYTRGGTFGMTFYVNYGNAASDAANQAAADTYLMPTLGLHATDLVDRCYNAQTALLTDIQRHATSRAGTTSFAVNDYFGKSPPLRVLSWKETSGVAR